MLAILARLVFLLGLVIPAFGQDARVCYFPVDHPDLEKYGAIAALLRF